MLRQAGKAPRNFIADGLPAHAKSGRKAFGKKANHARHIRPAGRRDRDNSRMGRLDGEIRDREKAFRGPKMTDAAMLDGMRVYRFAKRHGAPDLPYDRVE